MRLSHPLVYYSTSPPVHSTTSLPPGRSHGGIYLLVKLSIHPLIQSTRSTTHSITVSLLDFHFAAVCYPSDSIQEDCIKQNLLPFGPVDLLLGDINTIFPSSITLTTKRSNSTSSGHSLLFQTWTLRSNHFHLVDPYHGTISHKIPDYAFTSINSQSKISLSLIPTRLINFPTDHQYLLHIQYENQLPPPSQSCIPPHKPNTHGCPILFHVQRLKNPTIVKQY